MEKGSIIYINKAKHFGFIKNQATNASIHFNLDHIYGPVETGSLVTYICDQTPKGPTAYGVSNLENTCQIGNNFLNDTNFDNWYQRKIINDFFTEIIDEQKNLIFIEIRFQGWSRSSAPSGANIWLKPNISGLNVANFNNNVYNLKHYYQNCHLWYYINTTKTAAEEAAEAEAKAAAEAAEQAARAEIAAKEAAAAEAALAAEAAKAAIAIKNGNTKNIFVEVDDGYCGNTAIVSFDDYKKNIEYDEYSYVLNKTYIKEELPEDAILLYDCYGGHNIPQGI